MQSVTISNPHSSPPPALNTHNQHLTNMVPSSSLVLALHAAAAMASPLVLRAESAASAVLPEDVMVLNKNGASKSWPSMETTRRDS